ncbi:SecDF P1 head subdomain-containing protein [Lacipirellula sp.]|uniref:SecDF P1 head subdomain-containing protein n=1 Tax=Lacipirellula sp. TaxID=2691419 RepID=UPI003D108D53
MSAAGEFEFRILASPVAASDQAVVASAMRLPPEEKQLAIGGKVVAKWVGGLKDGNGPPNLLVHRQAANAFETLVLIDSHDVTGVYFTSVERGPGQSPAHPGLRIELNAKGSRLLGKLTAANLPTATGERHALALILDDSILAAPTIMAAISNTAIIEGLPEEEVDSLISIMNAGALPLPVCEAPQP